VTVSDTPPHGRPAKFEEMGVNSTGTVTPKPPT
jgi:hypothetical protein